ncbi:MAG: manganese efflux pump [Bacilli bacterium]
MFIIIIAISLSMDAFSLSLAYGTLQLPISHINKLSIIVALFHFFMPLLGMLIGTSLFHFLPINPYLIVFIILFFIGIQMIFESFKNNDKQKFMTFKQLLLFGFAVSVDSFSTGIGLKAITNNYLLAALCFATTSFIFTYLGLILGKKASNLIGKTATLIGGIILIIIGIIYLIK